ncbi:hypothetical protein GGX14DRAFT_463293 [Mycena pura]|uniref:C2H2-type domain-containing protein n=1 Tax=Mycena pura TaxID=153505 RepID=A0AAD6V4C1_9AGAR|nr:hypothetical protein GGX14DRAFT_463293 [Mycena pura]
MTSRLKTQQPTSHITISPQTIVELSKSVLVSLQCDTLVPTSHDCPGDKSQKMVPCGTQLNCWRTFIKHQTKHCAFHRLKPSREVEYICRLNKCSAKVHTSMDALRSHIEHSHLNISPLPCPFVTCNAGSVAPGRGSRVHSSREQDLIQHLQDKHAHLVGREINLHSDLLLPRAEPSSPMHSLPPPPDLPPAASIPPGSLFLPPITVPHTPRLTHLVSRPDSGPLPDAHTPLPVPRGRVQQLKPRAVPRSSPSHRRHSNSNGSSTKCNTFADLPAMEWDLPTPPTSTQGILGPPDFKVRRIGKKYPLRDGVRPLPMLEVPLVERGPPERSLFYDALAKQFFNTCARGEGGAA